MFMSYATCSILAGNASATSGTALVGGFDVNTEMHHVHRVGAPPPLHECAKCCCSFCGPMLMSCVSRVSPPPRPQVLGCCPQFDCVREHAPCRLTAAPAVDGVLLLLL